MDHIGEFDSMESIVIDKRSTKCPECQKTCLSHSGLVRHIRAMHNMKVVKRGQERNANHNNHQQHHQQQQQQQTQIKNEHISCPICADTFYQHDDLIEHVRTVHQQSKNRKYPCNMCSKVFNKFLYLMQHKKNEHSTSARFKCDVCDAGFNSHADLYQHMEHLHPQRLMNNDTSTTIECGICNDVFENEEDFRKHKEMHEEEEEFEQKHQVFDESTSSDYGDRNRVACKLCEKDFKNQKNLNIHVGKMHSTTPYRCPICSSTYGRRFYLEKHIQAVHKI